jgi:hypothetical protein
MSENIHLHTHSHENIKSHLYKPGPQNCTETYSTFKNKMEEVSKQFL